MQFILNEYQPGSFSTSWSTCAVDETREEGLVARAFDSISKTLPAVFPVQEHRDWFTDLPGFMFWVAVAHHDAEQDEMFATFTADAVKDLMLCHLRE